MRDPKRQNVFGNKFTVTYPNFPSFSRSPRFAVLRQEINKHDTLELHYQQFSPALARAFRTGTPITFTWANDKASGTFIGYTSDVVYPTTQKLDRSVVVTCVAASFPAKQSNPKIWKNKTASEIMTDLAKLFKLKPVITNHPLRFTQQSISDGTYWNKITELANAIGYGVKVVGAELHFHPIDKMINISMTTIPILAHLDPFTNPQSHFNAQTLDYFESTQGDYVETGNVNRTNKTVYGVDPITAKPYTHTSSPSGIGKQLRADIANPLFHQLEANIVSGSKAVAQALSEARSHLARLSIPGHGAAKGDPRVSPWATVEIQGTGDVSDGFWVVTKAEHTIHFDGRYVMTFSCAADGRGRNKPSAFRPAKAGNVPVLNVDALMSLGDDVMKKPEYTLSSPSYLIQQDQSGWALTPQHWKGK